jgi:hypothetical protein
MRKAGAFSLLALAGVLLAQESPRKTATDSLVAAAAQLGALVGHGYEALDAEARAALTPALVVSLETFRNEAIARGVEPMPIEVLEAFDGHLPDDVLASVRWRIEPESLLIGWNVLQSGMRAVTLDNLILGHRRLHRTLSRRPRCGRARSVGVPLAVDEGDRSSANYRGRVKTVAAGALVESPEPCHA